MNVLKLCFSIALLFIISQAALAQSREGNTRLILDSQDTIFVKIINISEKTITVENIKTGRTARIAKSKIVSMVDIGATSIQDIDNQSNKRINKSETDDEYAQIITQKNDTLIGKIITRNKDSLTFYISKMQPSERIAIADIKDIQRAEKTMAQLEEQAIVAQEKYYRHSTRNNLTTTAFPLAKGEGYYHNIMLGFNNVHVGITDNFSMGLGTELFTSDFNDDGLSWGIHAKYAGKVAPKVHLGISTFYASPSTSDENLLGIFGVGTLGDRRNNVTLGLGYVRSFDRLSSAGGGFGHLSGQAQLIDNFFFVGDLITGIVESEFFFLVNPGFLFKFNRWSLSANFIAFGAEDEGFFPVPVPIVGFTVNFGHKK